MNINLNYKEYNIDLSYPTTSNYHYTIQLKIKNKISNIVEKEIYKHVNRKGFMFFGETLNEFLQRVFKEAQNMLHEEVERLYYES